MSLYLESDPELGNATQLGDTSCFPALSICPYVFSCECLLKVIFLFICIWNIVMMRKKGIAFFSNSQIYEN